jgi:hypothetical protein
MRFVLIMTAVAGSSVAAYAQAPAAQEQEERRICKSVKETGSRLGRRQVCATQAEWKEVRRRGRDFTQGLQRGGARAGLPEGN